jgi:hypothetical protein
MALMSAATPRRLLRDRLSQKRRSSGRQGRAAIGGRTSRRHSLPRLSLVSWLTAARELPDLARGASQQRMDGLVSGKRDTCLTLTPRGGYLEGQ